MSRIERTQDELNAIAHGNPVEAIAAEMAAQDRHWGPAVDAGHTWAEWMLILNREVGEAAYEAGALQWDYPKAGDVRMALRRELIQICAVACQILAVIEKESA